MNQDMTPTPGGNPAGPAVEFISLAAILNILWRRRVMIAVIVLISALGGIVFSLTRADKYKAVATVRPGITSFSTEGEPIRDWSIKDIVRWFNQGMYSQAMRDSLGFNKEDFLPIIDAEFIPRGVGIQGGDVVTLKMLHENPQFADKVLSMAVNIFNGFAESNVVNSSQSLARSQLKSYIKMKETDLEDVNIKIDMKNLEILDAEQRLERLDYERQKVELLIQEQALKYVRQGEKSDSLEQSIAAIEGSFKNVELYLNRLLKKDEVSAKSDSLLMASGLNELAILKATLTEDKTALAGDLLLRNMTLRNTVWQDKLNVLTMRYNRELLKMEDQRDLLVVSMSIDSTLAATTNQIKRLEIVRDRSFASEIEEIVQSINSTNVKIAVLTPLERIGTTIVSDGPVYPKKRRMTMTAVTTGFFFAVILAFMMEYLIVNRRKIFADER